MPTTNFWNGIGIWTTSFANWSDGNPPDPTEAAEIQTGTNNLTTGVAIASLQVDAPALLTLTAGAVLTDTGSATVAGNLQLTSGGSASVSGDLGITGAGVVWLDSPFIGGAGGSNLAISGTLTNASTSSNALYIGHTNIGAADTVTAAALVNTGAIQITGSGTIQSTLNITTAAAGFGTVGVLTGSVGLTDNALLEFASGQIGTIDGALGLSGVNARIADAGTLATNSALVGLNTVDGSLALSAGASVSTGGDLALTGNGVILVDSPFNNGGGGSTLAVGGTLTVSSTNSNALYIGNTFIGAGDTVTAAALVNTGVIQIAGNGTIQSVLDIAGAAGFGTVGVATGSVTLTNSLLEFASGQIGTIVGAVALNGANALIADAGKLTTNSALTGLNTVSGQLALSAGASVTTTGGLSIVGNGDVLVDSPFNNGGGGSSLKVGGTLTNSSTNSNAFYIGNTFISAGDTVTANALVNTGNIQIAGNGTIQSVLDITTGAAGFGTVGVATGSVTLTNALLEFASGQIGTIAGFVGLNGANALIADAGKLTTNSALTGLNTVSGDFRLSAGASVTTTGGLSIVGNGDVLVDAPFNNGGGGSSLKVGGTLTVSSTNSNAFYIGNTFISAGDTVTAKALVNTGNIQITGNGTIESVLNISGAAGFGTLGVATGGLTLTNSLLEFASGQIGTIAGFVSLNGANALIADAGKLTTNSALTGLNTVSGDFRLAAGASVTTTGGLSITGNGDVLVDAPFNNGGGGSSLKVGGTLTVSSTNSNAFYIGNTFISAGDTVTAKALVNTGNIQITGNGTIQSVLNISGAAGFGTLGVATGGLTLTNSLLEFASGQIGTIAGFVSLNGANAVIADAGKLTTNSALTGLNTVSGDFRLAAGASVTTTGGLSITGSGDVLIDSPFNNGGGGSSLTVGGTLTNSSSNNNALYIGNAFISTGDTVTAGGLNNTGVIQIQGNGGALGDLTVNGSATNNASVNIYSSGELEMGAGDIYTQAAGATSVNNGGTLAGIVDVTGGAVNIVSGGTLAGTANVTGGSLDGTGTVVGTVNDLDGGTVFAGLAIGTPGTLTVSGDYDQSGTGNLEANIGGGGTSSGVVADTGGGYVNLTGGTLSVSSTPAIGTLLTVMTYGAGHLVGQFAAIQDGPSIGGGSFVDLGDGTSLEVFYNNSAGNIQIERVNNASLATSYKWTAATGNWNTAANWSGGQVPNPTANVVIGNTATGNVTLNGSSGDQTVNSLSILASNALTVSGVTLTSATGGAGISVAAGATLSLASGEINGSVLSGAGLIQTVSGNSALAGDTISANTTFIGQNNTSTELLGAINNAGTIEQIGGNGANGILTIGDSVTLTGGGTVLLDSIFTSGGSAYVQGVTSNQTLTNTDNTILGTGVIGNGNLVLINAGLIEATPESGTSTLTLNGGGITNTGTMEATAGALLVITPIVDNAGGTIITADATSTVELLNAQVQGGTVQNAAGGTMESVGNAALDGATHGALTISAGSFITATDNSTTTLKGTINNLGTIEQIGGNGANGILAIGGAVTLTGGGTVLLDTNLTSGGAAFILGNGGTLTNANNTIVGTGVIGNGSLAVINGGVIDATPEGGTSALTLNGSGGVKNTKLLEATAGGSLLIQTNVTNTGANITATGSLSAVTISNGATITGGALNAVSGGVMGSTGSATLKGVTLSSGSLFTASDNSTTTLQGTIVNQGTIKQIGGNGANGLLVIGGAVTLLGGGKVLLDSIATSGGNAFIMGNGGTLTNTSNTILGTGVIGNGSLTLINGGVIDATPEDGTSTLTLNGSGGVTNTKLLEATAGGALSIVTNVTNTGANITATGSQSVVTVSGGAVITGGTLNTSSGGAMRSSGSATLQGVTISAKSLFTSSNGTNTTLLGTINNLGTIAQIGGNGQNAFLSIGNAVTLIGGGTVLLDTIATSGGNAFIVGNGNTLTNTNNTILGTGVIGNGSLALINGGVIDATPEDGTSTLTLNGSGGVTNTNLLEATAGGALSIQTNVANTGGTITATGSLSAVTVSSGATITGGTLNTASGGVMGSTGSATLQGVTLSANSLFTSANGSTATLLGTINNLGAIAQVGGNGQNAFLSIGNAVTLTGGGTVLLDTIATSGGSAFLVGNGNTLTNTNNKIMGAGIIGNGNLALINGGVIDAAPVDGSSTLTVNTSGLFSSTGTLEATGGATLALNVGAVTVSGLVSVAASSALNLTGKLTVNGTLANFGAVSGGGPTEIAFGSGTTRLILGPDETFGGNVVGGGVNSTIELAAGADAGTLNALGTTFTNFGTVIVDAGATWTVDTASSLLVSTIFIGDGALSTLGLTDAGTFSLKNVSNFGTIDLAAGNNTVTLTDKTLSGGAVTINDGASGNNSISATGDTAASKGKSLTFVAGTGTDSFKGGFENDTVEVAASSVGGDTLTGGSGTNTLVLTGAGSTNLSGVTKFPTIDLAATGITLTVTDALLSSGALTINDEASGNTVSAASDTAASKAETLTYNAGSGTDSFTGGFENDKVTVSAVAVGSDTLTGGSGTNTLTLTTAGNADLGGVSKFPTINLAAGNSTVTVTDTTLSGGTVTINDGASGNNSVSAVGDTSASKGKALIYNAGTGTDSFTGGFENDVVRVSAAAVGGDTLTGGSGGNTLLLTSAGTFSLGGVSKFAVISLTAGNSTVTVTDTTLSGGTVTISDGASGNNTISAAGDTAASTGKTLIYNAGTGTDHFTGGFENDVVRVSAAAIGGDTLTGGSGTNTLTLTTAGTFTLGGVSKFGTINLAAGNNTVTVTDKTLAIGSITLKDGASGNNSVSATGDTAASKGKTLNYTTGTGTDSFTGGFENDVVRVSAVAVGGDTLTGGSGANVLTLTSAGSVNLGGVSKFATINLAAGNSTVTVTDKTLSGGTVTIIDGASGANSVSAAGDTAASKSKTLNYTTGSGKDSFTGGFENDKVTVSAAAVGGDTLTGGSGANVLTLTSAGSVNLGGVSKFATINLAAGNSTVTVTDKTLSGGTVTIIDGASGANSVSAAGDTAASKSKTLNYTTGSGKDSFTGGFENDKVTVSAAAVGGDTLTGGSGTNTLTLTSAGSANLGGVSKFATINLAAGNSTVTVTDKTLSGGTVTINDGASGNNTITAAGDTVASTGKALIYAAGTGVDHFTGGFENDTVRVSAAAVGGDTLTGGSGANTLTLITAGTFSLGGVSKFGTINLAAGNNTVTVTDKTLTASITLKDGASGNNSVSAAGDTAASKTKTLNYTTGSGTDNFTGGFENDAVRVSAAAVGGDTLTGGSGANSLTLTSAGSVNLGGVSKFGTINLAAGNNTVTVTDKTLSGGTVTINAGVSGNNSVSAAGDTAASKGKTLTYVARTGTDSFTGGFENDVLRVSAAAVGGDTLTGGSGTNSLTLTSAGSANLGGVSKFGTINLAVGNSIVTVTDKTLSGGAVTINDGTSGNNSVSAAGDTAASTGKTLTYGARTGTDSFTGGFENDKVTVSAAAVGGDTLSGGSGTNSLTLTSAGSANLGGVSKFGTINLAVGNSTVTVTDTTLSGGTVTISDNVSGNNGVSAAGDTSASTGKTLTYIARTGTDHFTGGFENDVVRVSAVVVGGDTLTGGSGANTLVLTTAGTFGLGGVSNFGTVDLATGNNTVTVTDKTLSGGSVAVHGGASGNNSISAAGNTAASTGKSLTDYLGTGTDSFTGGFENDTIVTVNVALNAADSINGGSGSNTLMLSGGGLFNLGALKALTNIQTVNAAEGQAAGGGVPNGVQIVTLRAGLDVTVNVASGTPNPLDPNPETITINGAANNDVINLGNGTDTVVIGGTGETVNAGNGTALVNATAAFAGALINGGSGTTNLKITTGGTATLNASDSHLNVNLTFATNLTLSKMSFITAVGSTASDTISALAQGQTLTGGGGKDTLNGFSGFGDVFSDTSAHLNTTTIGNFGGSDLIDLTDMNPNSIQPLAYNTSTETLTVADGTHTSNIKFLGSYTLSDFQIGGSDGHTGTLIKFV